MTDVGANATSVRGPMDVLNWISKPTLTLAPDFVRVRVESGSSATSRYSITSSARCSSDCGTVSPSALAVFRLMGSSNLLGRQIAGLCTLQDFPRVNPLQTVHRAQVRSIAEQTAGIDVSPPLIDRRNGVA